MNFLKENKSNRVQVTGGNRQSDHDYVGVLGVYHHLHCLNNLRRAIHWDYYGPRMSGLKHLEGLSKEHSGKRFLISSANNFGLFLFHRSLHRHYPPGIDVPRQYGRIHVGVELQDS